MAEKPIILKILVSDRYLDFTNRAVHREEGDELRTRVPYGQTLVNAGLARPIAPSKLASEPAVAQGGPVESDLNVAKMNIDDVLEAIKAGDFTPEEALEAELGRGKNARATLVQKLEAIIGFGKEAGDEENG